MAILGRAISLGLQTNERTRSQTPGGTRIKSKIPEPSMYDGTKGAKAKQFMNQCEVYFSENTESFTNDRSQITYALRRMEKGLPADWASILEQDLADGVVSGPLRSWNNFKVEFLRDWIDPAAAQEAGKKLQWLRQGARSANDYATEFQVLANQTEFDEPSRMMYFRDGLNTTVKNEVIRHEVRHGFTNLREMIREEVMRDNAETEI